MEEKEVLKLRKLIRRLAAIRGRHTELVSLYISAGANLAEVCDMLRQEAALAQRVKDKTVRKNVISALEKILAHVRFFRQTPTHGLAIFCGNIATEPGKVDVRLWSLEPPSPLVTKLYRCDQIFILDPLKEMIREREVYGLIVLDAREADIGFLRGKAVEPIKHLTSTVPAKTVKGGMSAVRYDRIREEAIHEFLRRVGEAASHIFLPLELRGILVGGPGPIKDDFVRGEYLHYKVRQRLLGVKSTSYTGEYGLEELVRRATDLLAKAAVVRERKLLERFFTELRLDGKVVYGVDEVRAALGAGAIDILLISETFDWVVARFECACGTVTERALPRDKLEVQTCGGCGASLTAENVQDLTDLLTQQAKAVGTSVEFISVSTGEGVQFSELGGLGGLLRYKIR
jgi:peptide chain release factor subunit 1